MDRLHLDSKLLSIRSNNLSKRIREEMNNQKPPLAPQTKRFHVAKPPPSDHCYPAPPITDVLGEPVKTTNGKAPRGMWIELDGCDFFEVFFTSHSHLDSMRQSISKPFVLEGYKPSDEIMDDDVERIWGPILRQPLIPLISRTKRRFRI